MRDPITDAAQDPSCLLCLTPDRGGSWWSRLRPAMPRNFAANPMTWTDFMAAIADATETDWSFKIKYTLNGATGSQRIFCGGSNTGPIAIFWSSDGLMYLRTIGGNGTIIQANPASDPTGTHTVEIIAASGLYSIIYDGETVRSVQDTPTIPVLVTGDVISSQFYGTIEQAEFLCGAVVWQATYSELYAIYEPRNFSAAPMVWSSFETLTAGYNGDFIFRIVTNFRSISDNPQKNEFFFNSRWVPFAFRMNSETRLFGWLNGSDPDAGVELSIDLPVSILGMHVLKVARTGLEFVVTFDGVELYRTSVDAVRTFPEPASSSAIRSHYHSDFDGSITEVEFSAPALSWSAPHGDLYDMLPPPPWPSPVPRNFAEEPEAWRDEKTTAPLIGEDDCEFFIRYRLDGYPEGSAINRIFYHNSQNGSINIAFAGDGTGGNYSVIRLTDTDGFVIPLNYLRRLGEHTIRVRRVGLTVTVEFDGEVAATSTGTEKVAVYSTTAPVSDFDGVIFETYWKSLTTGRTVWSYPSEAERVRLITKTNVRTDRGAFEAADETQPARVDTALDLRGKVSSYTVVVDFEAAALENESVDYCKQELAGQGASKGSIPSPLAVNYNKQLNVDTFEYRLEVSVDIAGARHLSEAILPGHLAGRNSVVAVVELMDDKTRLSIYHCGVLLKSEIVDGIPKMDGYTCPNSFALMDNRNGLWSNYYGKIHSCLLFDRALSTAEIAALTPKKQPLSWAGIRDVVRRGRAQRYFAVGDVLTVATPRWTIEYEVTGFDQAEPADTALTHTMTLLPVRLVTNLQFDATEPGNPDANRAQYGCNRWDWSAIRQWLNSAAAPGEWWTAQHEYDAAPAYAATLAGFMADLPADFLSAVAPARLTTALSNADGGGSVETVDRFWLPSRTEIFGALDGGIAEGVQMAKYIDATDADRIKYNSAGTASGWEFRSPNRSNSYNISNVSANGTWQDLTWSSAWSGGIVPACIIA